ncbi:MAG: carboxypeptidase regulatory-like domain-containing protein [Firmicutes bacterium]|nr:carboxypeptidase regulatory-like domain-containing protein [Bacillota bacterium]
MRKGLLIALVLVSIAMAGCDGRLFVNLDIPIVVEPAPPKYKAEVDGYLSYDNRTHHIRLTTRPNYDRYYQPLRNARVTVVGTGQTVETDRDGYFFMRGVPYGQIEIKVQHSWIGPYHGVYFTTRGR